MQQDDDRKHLDVDFESQAGSNEPPRDQSLDHEYSIPTAVKFSWLGAYFFFSLLLTIYNKMVLRVVSPLQTHPISPVAVFSVFS